LRPLLGEWRHLIRHIWPALYPPPGSDPPNPSRRRLLSGAAVLALLSASPRPARAVAFVCVNCSTIWQQIMEYTQQVYSIGVQLQQYRTQIMQYLNMVQNTVALPQQLWNFVTNDIQQIKNLANIGALLAGNAGGITATLANFNAAASQTLGLADIVNKYNSWSQMAGQNVTNMQLAFGMAQNQMASDAALVQSIQAQSDSAVGQMQVLQAANEMASVQVSQTMQLHQTMMSQGQALAAFMNADAARQAEADQATINFLAAPLLPMTGNKRY
jgi:P-type conjugative transfer protein TrbJ